MLGALLAVGITMSILESSANHEDFPGTTSVSKLVHIWNGAYLSVAGFTSKTEEFSPKTIPGRILGLLNSFAVWLALAMYIANLAAVFTNGQMMVEVRGGSGGDLAGCHSNPVLPVKPSRPRPRSGL